MLLKQKHVFTNQECDTILELEKKKKREWSLLDRSYTSYILEHEKNTTWIFKKLLSFFEDESGIKIHNHPGYIHYHIFKNGDYFFKHNDTKDSRLYSVGCLLNENFEGGDFEIYGGKKISLNKTTGNCYLFDVRLEHEIKKITNGERHSLILFLGGENMKLEKTSII